MTYIETHLEPTQSSAWALIARAVAGEVVMLNLLRFRDIADYSATPELAPATPITGAQAYDLYVAHTLPLLQQSGGEALYYGEGGQFLVGPQEERWDRAMLVRQRSVDAFFAFAVDAAYLAGVGHRTAGLADARLLPLTALPAHAHHRALRQTLPLPQ